MNGSATGGFGSIFILLIIMVAFFFLMSIPARKAQKKQAELRAEAIVVGNNVVTVSGFLGRIVDIDGDAVTLESPAGDETVWLRSSIASQMDIPFADAPEDDVTESADAVEETVAFADSDSLSTDQTSGLDGDAPENLPRVTGATMDQDSQTEREN